MVTNREKYRCPETPISRSCVLSMSNCQCCSAVKALPISRQSFLSPQAFFHRGPWQETSFESKLIGLPARVRRVRRLLGNSVCCCSHNASRKHKRSKARPFCRTTCPAHEWCNCHAMAPGSASPHRVSSCLMRTLSLCAKAQGDSFVASRLLPSMVRRFCRQKLFSLLMCSNHKLSSPNPK